MTTEDLEDLRLAKQAGCKKTGEMRSDAAFYYAVAIEAEVTPEELFWVPSIVACMMDLRRVVL